MRTHDLGDLGELFTSGDTASGGGKRIRICVVDTLLQTGGAEWYATQLALLANPAVFELVVVAYKTEGSVLAGRLKDNGIRVISSVEWSRSGLTYDEWKERVLFDLLDRLRPDLLFFSAQYLFEQLPKERLADHHVVVRISNFHADELARTDFSAAKRVICCTQEQFDAVADEYRERATLINTGVNTDLFRPAEAAEQDDLKRAHGVGGKKVVLFVARLSDPLKRTPVFQEVVRAIRAKRSDVAFVVVGYFESYNEIADAEARWRTFVEQEEIIWKHGLAPWEMPDVYRMADILVSTSAAHEGLSNTVLQALSTGVVPVVTASAGMQDLVDPGAAGFIAESGEADEIVERLCVALDLDDATRASHVERGRRRIDERFSLAASSDEYQRQFVELFRCQPARVCITDGYFGVGGAEWLAALLILNSDPADVRFDLVMHRERTELVDWLKDRGVRTHEAPIGMNFDDWLGQGMADMLGAIRPEVVMPCTITTWPRHDPFYRLLIISQNASDAAALQPEQYDQADWFLCVSEDVRNQLSTEHRWKMSVLHNSIDVEMFSPDPVAKQRVRAELGIAEGAKVALWCGRMHETRKRLDVLRETISAVRDDASIQFLVVGYFRGTEGDREGWVEFMREHPNVSWAEDVSPWQTPQYYAAADVYLSTSGFKRSDFEGLSVATVQALATALPVITTRSGGQEEVVEEGVNGRLVDPGDADAVAQALRELLRTGDAEFDQMQRRSRERALEHFDIRRHAELYGRIVRLLKANVGTALAADPELPAAGVVLRDDESLAEDRRRLAAGFVAYTWPLLRECEHGVDDVATVVVGADAQALAEANDQLASGEWLAVRDVGPDCAAGDSPAASAAAVCAVLDHLDIAFPRWSRAERHGPHLMLEKR